MYLYIRSENRFNRYYFISVLSFFIGTLCKEPALTIVVLLVAYDFLLNKNKAGSSILFKRYTPFILAASAYLGIRYFALSGSMVPQGTGRSEYGLYDLLIILKTYINKLVVPYNLQPLYSFRPVASLLETRMLVALFIIALAVVIYYFCFRKDRLAFFCLLTIAGPASTVSLLTPAITGPSLLAERYLYLPSVGFVMWSAVDDCLTCCGIQEGGVLPPSPVFLALIALYSAGTVLRNADWKDDYSLWSDTVRSLPKMPQRTITLVWSTRKRDNMGWPRLNSLTPKGYPIDENAYKNLGRTYSNMGKVDESISAFSEFLKDKPDDADVHNDLGIVYVKKNDLKRAKEHFQIAVSLNPSKRHLSGTWKRYSRKCYDKDIHKPA